MRKASATCEPETMDAEDMLYILYTSGTTGKPKGIVHTTGGYLMARTRTTKWVFDLKEDDVFWCTADVGWVTGHSYIVYGPLANGATVLMYEGAPDWPAKDRFWDIVETLRRDDLLHRADRDPRLHEVGRRLAGQARSLDAASARIGRRADQSRSLDVVSQAHRQASAARSSTHGGRPKPGAIMITPLPGITRTKPGSRDAARSRASSRRLLDDDGKADRRRRRTARAHEAVAGDAAQHLRRQDRYVKRIWSRWTNDLYFTGDGAKRDDDGYLWLLGRVDDVLNVAGHRIGTMEVESALVDHPAVAEAAVVGRAHDLKGQAVAAFVTVKEGVRTGTELSR